MTPTASSRPLLTKASAFRLFKALVFLTLIINFLFYLYEDVTAYLYVGSGATLSDSIESFAVSIDYAAWLLLIVLFEMETNAQTKGRLLGWRKFAIAGMTAACYVVLVYAWWGYVHTLERSFHFEPIAAASVCDLTSQRFAYLSDEGRPIELTHENCGSFANEVVFKSPGDNVIVTEASLLANRKLNWVDVINATAWLLVVLLFQVGVWLSMLGRLTTHNRRAIEIAKGTSYLALLGCAIYWTAYSAFIDSWDAWLWLVAFVLIDLNLLGLDDSQAQPAKAQIAA